MRRFSFALLVAAALAVPAVAIAQRSVSGIPARDPAAAPEFSRVVSRLDGLTIGVLVAAVVVLALLVWRVWSTVRRERPMAVPAPRRSQVGAERGDTLERPTDWGFDQNKRAALARSPVVIENSTVDLPSLEHAVTQWSVSDVQNANSVGILPDDAMGKSPLAVQSLYRTSFNPYFKPESPANMMEVVEVADALLQAELLVQLGDPKQAMTLLSQHIRETEKPGPAVWLMLLSLYQSTGREAQYNALSEGFRVLFNAQVPVWATTADAMARDLESYLQVMSRLQTLWSGADARPYVERLLNDDRGGSRQGFSLAAYRELLFLVEILDALDAITADEAERDGIQRKLGALP